MNCCFINYLNNKEVEIFQVCTVYNLTLMIFVTIMVIVFHN